jgi:hypothetical protein
VASEDHHRCCTRRGARTRTRSLLAPLSLCTALLLHTAAAAAVDLAGAELVVERSLAAQDCPDAAALARATLGLGSPPTTRAAALALTVRFDRRLDGYSAVIQAAGRKQGTRELHHPAPTCRPLADATSVVLAVLSDLIPPPDPEAEPKPVPVPAPPPAPAPRSFSAAIGIESGLAYGLLGPSVTGTVSALLRGRYQAAELELGAFWGLPHYDAVSPGVLETQLFSGTALGCWWFGASVGACVGSGLGVLDGSGHGFDHDGSATAPWFTGLAGLAGRISVRPRWSCRFSLSAVVPFGSQSFLVAPLEEGFRSAPAAVWLRFGPEFRFW